MRKQSRRVDSLVATVIAACVAKKSIWYGPGEGVHERKS